MNKRTLRRAIGTRAGNCLVIANDCASVCIQSEEGGFHVGRDADEETFAELSKAVAYAFEHLALYMDGSPNK